MKREAIFLTLLFLISFTLSLIFVFSSGIKWWDEAVYANLGYDLSKNPFHYSFDGKWSDYMPRDWPKAGFRPPLLPYLLAIFYFLKIKFLIKFFIPFVFGLSAVILFMIGKKFFNEKIAFYSSLLFSLFPLNIYFGGKILNDLLFVFLVLLSIICFWDGFEENKNKYKILFGVFFALALLSRYTALWFIPIFLIYFLLSKKLKFLTDRYFWLSIIVFFIVISSWLVYGVKVYGNPFGPFLHGFKASSYWGGNQPWFFYFKNHWGILSILGIISSISIILIFYKREFKQKQIYFLLIWILIFLFLASLMQHKEGRYLLPIIPALCILSGVFLSKIKNFKKPIFILIILILIFGFFSLLYKEYKDSRTETNNCYLSALEFLKNENVSLIVTSNSALIYYYTKKETLFYPQKWYSGFLDLLGENKSIFFLVSDYEFSKENLELVKADLKNSAEVFNCKQKSFVYEY